MTQRVALAVGLCLVVFVATGTAAEEDWKLKGNWAESCCCQPACPCVFESTPTLGHCEGSALFEIEEGHYGDVDVGALDAVITYRIGEWVRLYVDDDATGEQVKAVAKLLKQPNTFGMLFEGDVKVLSTEKAPISVEKSDSKIAFSTPDAKVELRPMTGPNGKAVRIENLGVPWFLNGYTQYTAATTEYKRNDVEFAYSGTNGATSHVDASGEGAANE